MKNQTAGLNLNSVGKSVAGGIFQAAAQSPLKSLNFSHWWVAWQLHQALLIGHVLFHNRVTMWVCLALSFVCYIWDSFTKHTAQCIHKKPSEFKDRWGKKPQRLTWRIFPHVWLIQMHTAITLLLLCFMSHGGSSLQGLQGWRFHFSKEQKGHCLEQKQGSGDT